jgi:hypothetical protein
VEVERYRLLNQKLDSKIEIQQTKEFRNIGDRGLILESGNPLTSKKKETAR